MTVSRLECPECGTILRPARPVAAGKKVKCPECDTVFVAGDEDDDEPPRRSTARKSSKAAPAKGKKNPPVGKQKEKPAPKKEEEEIYGYIKEDEEEEEEKKPRIEYAPDESIRDLRGPAIVKLTNPASKLQLVGMFGVMGWIALFVLLLIPTAFPITPDEKELEMEKMLAASGKEKKVEKTGPPFFDVWGLDIGSTRMFLILMVPMILMGVYSALVVGGGIKAQNLESRAWGITASVLVMLPLHVLGLALVFFLVIQWGLNMVLDDQEFVNLVAIGFASILYLSSLGIGVWNMITLMDEEVIAGFEFDPD